LDHFIFQTYDNETKVKDHIQRVMLLIMTSVALITELNSSCDPVCDG